jgi:hypothetical protein
MANGEWRVAVFLLERGVRCSCTASTKRRRKRPRIVAFLLLFCCVVVVVGMGNENGTEMEQINTSTINQRTHWELGATATS